jgi:hypothetical protein
LSFVSDDKPATKSPFPSGVSSIYLLSSTYLPSCCGWIYATGYMACKIVVGFNNQNFFFSLYIYF